jgi:hypothetical protein
VTAGRSNVAKAWVIRTGRYGERDQWALDNSVSGGGWYEYPDLTPYDTKEKIAKLVQATYPGEVAGKLNNWAGQLWALRDRIRPGDLLVLPLKTTKQRAELPAASLDRRSGQSVPLRCRRSAASRQVGRPITERCSVSRHK